MQKLQYALFYYHSRSAANSNLALTTNMDTRNGLHTCKAQNYRNGNNGNNADFA